MDDQVGQKRERGDDFGSGGDGKHSRKDSAELDALPQVLSDDEIHRLTSERDDCRRSRDFTRADDIKKALQARGIEVWDKDQRWAASDGRSGYFGSNAGGAASTSMQYSEQEIVAKLKEREAARKRKDWTVADVIKNELQGKGIAVLDKEALWKARDGRQGSFATVGWDLSSSHSLSDSQIQQWCDRRDQARKAKDFETSDKIKNDLRDKGIEVWDKSGVWKCNDGREGRFGDAAIGWSGGGLSFSSHLGGGGGRSSGFDPSMSALINPPMGGMAGISSTTPPLPSVDNISQQIAHLQQLQQQLLMQQQAQLSGQQAQMSGSSFQTDLSSFDSSMPSALGGSSIPNSSSTIGGLAGAMGGYDGGSTTAASFGSIPTLTDGPLSDTQITQLLQDRETARATKKWDYADSIKASLRASGIDVDDKAKTWRSPDGRSGSFAGGTSRVGSSSSMFGPGAVVSPGASSAMISESEIVQFLVTRDRARANKDWTTADSIKTLLRDKGIEVWDKDKMWKAKDGREGSYAYALETPAPAGSISEFEIAQYLKQRDVARAGKDFTAADQIKNFLRASGIEVWDKERTWKDKNGRAGSF